MCNDNRNHSLRHDTILHQYSNPAANALLLIRNYTVYKKDIPLSDLNKPTSRELPPSDNMIEPTYRNKMNVLAHFLDYEFNGDREPKKVAFVMFISEFNAMQGRVNFISNAKREDIIVMLKEILARFDGQPEMEGKA